MHSRQSENDVLGDSMPEVLDEPNVSAEVRLVRAIAELDRALGLIHDEPHGVAAVLAARAFIEVARERLVARSKPSSHPELHFSPKGEPP